MRRYFIKLVILEVFEGASLLFGIKGHTHNILDGLGGHAVTRMSHECWDSPHKLSVITRSFLPVVSWRKEPLTRVHKHDEAADWNEWLNEVPLQFNAITGPVAPHHFRICRRFHLSMNDLANAKLTYCSNLREPDSQDDLVLALYQYMSDPMPYQVVKLFSPSQCKRLKMDFFVQPGPGNFPRRKIKQADREKVVKQAKVAYDRQAMSQEAYKFLTMWATGTMRRHPRPTFYSS